MHLEHNSALIKVDTGGDTDRATPGTDPTTDNRYVVVHLTRNAAKFINQTPYSNAEEAQAIGLDGSIDVQFGPSEHRSDYKFRFIQLGRVKVDVWVYAGQTPEDGSIWVDYAPTPAFPARFANQFSIDSGGDSIPFYNLREQQYVDAMSHGHVVPGKTNVQTSMYDHPNTKHYSQLTNHKTGKSNRLFYVAQDLSFLTAFVVRNEATKVITPLAHLSWHVVLRAQYSWHGNRCIPFIMERRLDVSNYLRGPPNNSEWAAKITNPNTNDNETSNKLVEQSQDAIERAMHARQNLGLNLVYSDTRPSNVLPNFWI